MLRETQPYEWSAVVFAANEAQTLANCIASVEANYAGKPLHLTVMLNGNSDGSLEIIRRLPPGPVHIAVYAIETADKANAINQFIYKIRPKSDFYFFLDAYVTLSPGTLAATSEALPGNPAAHVASAYPLNGRSARSYRKMLQAGAINGNCYCVRTGFLDRLVTENIRLPLRIYRTDPLFGSIAAHDFDSLETSWDAAKRMIAPESATYSFRSLSPMKWGDIKRQFRREINQARGLLEVEAIKSIIYKDGYRALPADADQMIKDWLATHRYRASSLRSKFFLQLALRKLRSAPPLPPSEKLTPRLVYERPPAWEPSTTGRPDLPAQERRAAAAEPA